MAATGQLAGTSSGLFEAMVNISINDIDALLAAAKPRQWQREKPVRTLA